MDIGIGLPNAVRGADRAGIVEWAIRAERAGFSTLGTIDRIVFANLESLVALAAAGAVTERIGLATDILIAPLRANTALLAKQAASIEAIAGPGRLTLGLAVGGREDDFAAGGVDFHRRGRIFERQLGELRSHWSGETGVGPEASPALLVGGTSDAAVRRVARHGDGWTSGGGGPDGFARVLPQVLEAWQAEGREGRPRTQALCYFGLGPSAAENVQRALGDYYGFAGPYAESLIASAPKDEGAMRDLLARFEQTGVDEVVCFPTSTDPEQVDLLASAVL